TTPRLRELVETMGWEEAKKLPEVRRFLQELGMGVRKVIGENAWVGALEKLWVEDGCPDAVITDVRFDNECAWVHRQMGVVLRVTRYEGIGRDGSDSIL